MSAGASVTYKKDLLMGLQKNMSELNEYVAETGYYQGTEYPDGRGVEVAAVATWHEFGDTQFNVNYPERSFMRSALSENRSAIAAAIAKAMHGLTSGKLKPGPAMAIVARVQARAIYKKLMSATSWAAPLADSTVAAKGHARVLVETELLRNSLTWRVRRGDRIVAQGRAKNVKG